MLNEAYYHFIFYTHFCVTKELWGIYHSILLSNTKKMDILSIHYMGIVNGEVKPQIKYLMINVCDHFRYSLCTLQPHHKYKRF